MVRNHHVTPGEITAIEGLADLNLGDDPVFRNFIWDISDQDWVNTGVSSPPMNGPWVGRSANITVIKSINMTLGIRAGFNVDRLGPLPAPFPGVGSIALPGVEIIVWSQNNITIGGSSVRAGEILRIPLIMGGVSSGVRLSYDMGFLIDSFLPGSYSSLLINRGTLDEIVASRFNFNPPDSLSYFIEFNVSWVSRN